MLDHPGAIQVPTGAPKWPKTALNWPRMAQNHQNGSKWHCMTPNDPKTLPMGILHDYMSCWTNLDPFQRPIQHCYSPYRTTQFDKTIKKRQNVYPYCVDLRDPQRLCSSMHSRMDNHNHPDFFLLQPLSSLRSGIGHGK